MEQPDVARLDPCVRLGRRLVAALSRGQHRTKGIPNTVRISFRSARGPNGVRHIAAAPVVVRADTSRTRPQSPSPAAARHVTKEPSEVTYRLRVLKDLSALYAAKAIPTASVAAAGAP